MSKGFQFKQFYIAHDQCGMKVGTDAILLGSWVQVGAAKHILDIGTGSAILAIMLAQNARKDAQITALEIDPNAVEQARQNVAACAWANRIQICHQPAQQHKHTSGYELIISNPPYFTAQSSRAMGLASEPTDEQRQNARHSFQLSYSDLITSVMRLLSKAGRFVLVLPADMAENFTKQATQSGLYCSKNMQVYSYPGKAAMRTLLEFQLSELATTSASICIHNKSGGYSQAYRQLCKDFYVNF